MNYFLRLDGLEPTGYGKDGLLDYLYKVKNLSQNLYQNELDAFRSIVDAPNCVFGRVSNADPIVLPSCISKSNHVCPIGIIPQRLDSINEKGYCMVIYEVYNQDFEYFVSFYLMHIADWNSVLRKNIIDEFLVDNA